MYPTAATKYNAASLVLESDTRDNRLQIKGISLTGMVYITIRCMARRLIGIPSNQHTLQLR